MGGQDFPGGREVVVWVKVMRMNEERLMKVYEGVGNFGNGS